jgi:hypothetical protein
VVVTEGLVGTNFPVNKTVKVKFTIVPTAGFTLKAPKGPDSYFDVDAEKVKILAYLKEVYKGTSRVDSTGNPLVTIDSLYMEGENLIIEASYLTKPRTIVNSDFTLATLGDFDSNLGDGDEIPDILTATSNTDVFEVTGVEWTAIDHNGDDFEITADRLFDKDGSNGVTYTATFTIAPKDGYTFVGSTFANFKTRFGNVWTTSTKIGSTSSLAITVKGFDVFGSDTQEVISGKDRIVVTITFKVS